MANEFRYTIRADDRSKTATDEAQRNMRDVGQTAQRVGQALKTAFTVTALVAAGRQLARISSDLQKAYAVQERAERKLSQAVAASPLVDGTATHRLQEFASELQGITTIGDEVTIDLAAMAVTWGRNEKEIRQLITTSANLSEALGMDLTTAARAVNHVFEGNITQLGRYVPELRNLTAEQIEAGEAMEILEQRFGGMAEAMRDTTEGSMKAFANAWGDLQESFGREAAERMRPVRDFFTDLMSEFHNRLTTLQNFRDAMRDIIAVSGGEIAVAEVRNVENYLDGLERRAQEIQAEIRSREADVDWMRASGAPAMNIRDTEREIATLRTELEGVFRALEEGLTEQMDRQAADYSRQRAATQEAADAANDAADANDKVADAAEDAAEELGKMSATATAWIEDLGATFSPNAIVGSMIRDIGTALDDATSNLVRSEVQMQTSFSNMGMFVDTTAGLISGELIPSLEYLGERALGLGEELDREYRRMSTGRQDQTIGGSLAMMGGQNPMEMLSQGLAAMTGPIGLIANAIAEMLANIEAVVTIMAPLKVVLEGVLAAIGPLINEALAPLIGILHYFGRIIGHLLVPLFELWVPIIEAVAQAFIWMYNTIFVPIHNLFRNLMNGIYNFFANLVNAVIRVINDAINAVNQILLPRHRIGNVGYVSVRDQGHGHIDKIDMADLSDAGASAMGAGETGTAAQYTTGRNVTVNVDIFTDVIAGEGGIRDLALIIRDEIRSAEALGA